MRGILKKTITVILSTGIIMTLIGGCGKENITGTNDDTLGVITGETTVEKAQGNMETVFLDSKYVSGDSIDAFIDDEKVEKITIINKFSKKDTDEKKSEIERNGDEYVCDGKKYKYFYKITHSEGDETVQNYILGNVILNEAQYDNYIANSLQAEEGLVVVASNVIQ